MQKRHKNFNKTGGVSCAGLLLLAFLLVNPFVSTPVSALEEQAEDEADEGGSLIDGDIELYTTTPSTVNISFSPATGSASLSPTTSGGASAQVNVLTTVKVDNSNGYAVYLKGSSTNLIGKKSSSNVIPGATTAKTYANMDVNTWGYNATEGTTVPANATYKAVTVSTNGDKIAENTNKKITSDTKKIMLSFAAKINDTKPADTYQNTITLSVVSSPLQTTISDLTNMQDMDTATCTASANYESKQLKDTRDGKYYWVAKLGDGKCWMTQNLDLDLSTSKKLTATDSDVSAAGYTPAQNTATTASSSTYTSSATGQYSWSLGDYRITSPNTISGACSSISNAAGCTGRFTAYSTPTSANGDANAHYILGNHYQWNAATAGTGGVITSGTATNSVCSKGWRLPTSGEFTGLIRSLGTNTGTDIDSGAMTQAPFYGVRAGYVATTLISAGNALFLWSSTPRDNGTGANALYLDGDSSLYSSGNHSRSLGLPVRCVAK